MQVEKKNAVCIATRPPDVESRFTDAEVNGSFIRGEVPGRTLRPFLEPVVGSGPGSYRAVKAATEFQQRRDAVSLRARFQRCLNDTISPAISDRNDRGFSGLLFFNEDGRHGQDRSRRFSNFRQSEDS